MKHKLTPLPKLHEPQSRPRPRLVLVIWFLLCLAALVMLASAAASGASAPQPAHAQIIETPTCPTASWGLALPPTVTPWPTELFRNTDAAPWWPACHSYMPLTSPRYRAEPILGGSGVVTP